MVNIVVIKLNNFLKSDEFCFMYTLSRKRCEIIKRYHSDRDAYRSYISALLIRYILCNRF